jgi:hypothetical protein
LKTIHPGLGKLALERDLTIPYRWWVMLRGSKPDGLEWYTREEVYEVFATYGLDKTQYNRLVNDANCHLFFIVDPTGRLFLHSLKKICINFGIVPGQPFFIDDADLRKLKRFRAACYKAAFTEPRQAARSTLSQEFGISSDTQRRYEKIADVNVTQNYLYAPVAEFAVEDLPIPPDQRLARLDERWHWNLNINGAECWVWCGPNTYYAPNSRLARPGQSRRIGRTVRGLVHRGEAHRRFFHERLQPGRTRGDVALIAGSIALPDYGIAGNLWQFLHIGA